MKQKDIALIVLVVGVSGFISYFASGFLFASAEDKKQQVEVVQPLTSQFTEPDKKYFNDQSIDPTQLIRIGDSTNQQPFNANN